MKVEPRWLAKADVIELHDYVLARTGGSSGLRDEGLLESALARPFNRWIMTATDGDAVTAFYAIAASQMDEDALAVWVRANSVAT